MAVQKQSVARALALVASVAFCATVSAQYRPPYHRADAAAQSQVSAAQRQISPAQAAANGPAPASKPGADAVSQTSSAPSLLSQPAQPAKVELQAGKLTIEAQNSALSEILEKISQSGGMKVSGLEGGNATQRIFGKYGPGAPREVLSELLNGCDYNVLMLGTTASGVPKELTLSARPHGGVPNPPPQSAASLREQYEQDQIRPTQYAPEPQTQPKPPQPPAGGRPGIRTPQQILQELEQMRQRQQNQQSQNPNQR